jgi:hypothetical protein
MEVGMKTKLVGLAVFFSCATMTWAQTATLTAPNGGETWRRNGKQTITWTFTGSAKVRLVLIHKGGKIEGEIKSGLPLTAGSYEWTVGALEGGNAAPAGTDYLVRIVRMNGAGMDKSDKPFTIYDPFAGYNIEFNIPPGSYFQKPMKVTSPSENDRWILGSTYKIIWDKGGSGDKRVGISLYRQGKHEYSIPGFFANTGSHAWAIPGSIPPGDYVVKVFTVGDEFQADSKAFSIACPAVRVRIDNRWSLRNEYSTKLGCGPSQRSTQPAAAPAAGEILVGFDNFYDSGYCWEYIGHQYRGFVSFDLSEVRGVVARARLEMTRTTSVHRFGPSVSNATQCIGSVQVLDAAWSVDSHGTWHAPSHFYHALPDGMVSDGIVSYDGTKNMTIDITEIVRKWLSGQQANFGLMFLGRDQGYAHNNDACYSAFGSIALTVDME